MFWNRESLVLAMLLIVGIFLYILYIYLDGFLYTETPRYLQNIQQAQQLNIKNNQLKLELLEDESYTKIARKAAKMGFTQKANPINLR